MKLLLIILFALSGAPAVAEEIISPEEFEALSEGKTMYFSRGSELFGVEQFYKRHRSTWQYADGECTDGVWHSEGNLICFVYRKDPEKQCWLFIRTATGFIARAEGASPDADLSLSKVDTTPLNCKGPSVGA